MGSPDADEVLVQVEAAPVTGADQLFAAGWFGVYPELPAAMGAEGRDRPPRRSADARLDVRIERFANTADNGVEDLLRIFFEVTDTSRRTRHRVPLHVVRTPRCPVRFGPIGTAAPDTHVRRRCHCARFWL